MLLTLCIVSFGIGVEFHRKGIINKSLKSYLINTSMSPKRYLKGLFSDVERINIDVKHKHFEQIAYQREKALINGLHISSEAKYLPAKLNHDKNEVNIKIKLKGAHLDHWSDDSKWSLKVKGKNKSSTLFGMRRFSIMPPRSRGYIYEWLYQELLRKEGFIYKRIKYVNVTVNGNDNGIYILEEGLSNELLANNNKVAGPIITFDKKLWTAELIKRSGSFSLKGNNDFFAFPVKNENKSISDHSNEARIAALMLTGFRDGDYSLEDVFDVERLALFFAIRAIFLSKEIDRKDLDFYYNPLTSKLEPVGGEVHFSNSKVGDWWINEVHESSGNKDLIPLLFNSNSFYNYYYKALVRLSDKKYLAKFLQEVNDNLDHNLNILYKEHYNVDFFNPELLYSNQAYIRSILYPIKGINAFKSIYENEKVIKIGNICNWPIEIISFGDNAILPYKSSSSLSLNPKKERSVVEYEIFIQDTLTEIGSRNVEDMMIKYRIIGSEDTLSSVIFTLPQNSLKNSKSGEIGDPLSDALSYKYLNIDNIHRTISFDTALCEIRDHLIIPEGYKVLIEAGTKMDLIDSGQILSYSPIFITGEPDNPVFVYSSDSSGQGIAVLNAGIKSIIANTSFSNLSRTNVSKLDLVSVITFNNSPVEITACDFIDNRSGESYLHLINSDFSIENSNFSNSYMNSVIVEFCKGTISESLFNSPGNTAIACYETDLRCAEVHIRSADFTGFLAHSNTKIQCRTVNIKGSKFAVISSGGSSYQCKDLHLYKNNFGLVTLKSGLFPIHSTIHVEGIDAKRNQTLYFSENGTQLIIDNDIIEPRPLDANRELDNILSKDNNSFYE